jgi:hypothetical protein
MKKMIAAAIAVLYLVSANVALADGCNGLEKKFGAASHANGKVPGLVSKILVIFGGADPTPENIDCDSVFVALASLLNANPIGGKKLEPTAPLDRAAAQAELDSALKKPEVQQAIDGIKARVTDEDVRMVLEAAVFDNDGEFRARDLRIAQLRDKLGG